MPSQPQPQPQSQLQPQPHPHRPRSLNFITGNANKLSEVRAILGDVVEIQSRSLDQLAEIQGSIEEIAEDKCLRAAGQGHLRKRKEGPRGDTASAFLPSGTPKGSSELTQSAVILHRKWFLTALGHKGLNDLLSAYADKSATAICTFAFCAGLGSHPILFQGRTEGKIVEARGPLVFGWDPIFEFEGQTYAEMDKVEKNTISHRFKALSKLKDWLAEKPEPEPEPEA